MLDMELVSILSEDENNRIYKYIRDTLVGTSFWSSGTKLIDDKNWYWLPTGKKVEYTNWLPGFPDNKEEKCIQLIQQRDKGLMWNDLGCTGQLNFICQSPTEKYIRGGSCPTSGDCPTAQPSTVPPTPSLTPSPKPQDIYHLSKDRLTYSQATEACRNQSMKLVSIQTKEKNDAINSVLQKSGANEYYWTSGNRIADEKTWIWPPSEKITYFNWDQGEPNNLRTHENCLEVFKSGTDTKWNDDPCDQKNLYICESPAQVPVTGSCSQCCPSSVINVYVNNNLISTNVTDTKRISTTSSNKPGQSYDVEVNNNVNDGGQSGSNTKSPPSNRIHHHVSEKKHPAKHPKSI
nr:macrophage mannose receptor 1-like [Leptinotarsa decemlineata]